MERAVIWTLRSEQRLQGEAEQFLQHGEGTLIEEAEGLLLRYQEESGQTSLLFQEDTAELRRGGTRLTFRAGEERPGHYATPYGTLELRVRTTYLRHTMTAAGGKALLRYELLSEGGSMGEFALTIQVKPISREGAR